MPLHESELESEFEYESELEGELESERLGEEFAGEMLGEDEYEEEFEGEGESEEFLRSIVGGLLGEGEYEEESEEFFRGIASFVRKNAPLLRQVARVAAPMVGTALGGPLGGTLGNLAARALGEGESELEWELEDEYELEGEYEDEDEYEGELEAADSRPMTEAEALAEMMAGVAARAASEAEAEAMIGAATVTVLSPRDRARLRSLLPHLVRASCVLARLLRRQRRTRPALRTVPYIVQRTARVLASRAADGRPVDRRTAARVMSSQTRKTLGSPRRTATALRRNVRAAGAIRPHSARTGRGYAPRPQLNGRHRHRAYGYR